VTTTETDQVERARELLLGGDRRVLARTISWVERGDERGHQLVARLVASGGTGQVIGVTGPPGAGKSTLTSSLVRALRAAGERVGVVSVDPSSPFGGGALLGDRIRMTEHLGDDEVFIRSMASRGRLGGLSLAAPYAVALVEAWGADRVVLETVGIGQSEIDVAAHADAVVLVLNPATGDGIQALKAGIMEVPDVVAVNVRGGDDGRSEDAVRQLRTALQLGGRRTSTAVVAVDALRGDGVDELVEALDAAPAANDGRRADASTTRASHLAAATAVARVDAALLTDEGRRLVAALAEGDEGAGLGPIVSRLLAIAAGPDQAPPSMP
jgi:LAO/AO transport system kinase